MHNIAARTMESGGGRIAVGSVLIFVFEAEEAEDAKEGVQWWLG